MIFLSKQAETTDMLKARVLRIRKLLGLSRDHFISLETLLFQSNPNLNFPRLSDPVLLALRNEISSSDGLVTDILTPATLFTEQTTGSAASEEDASLLRDELVRKGFDEERDELVRRHEEDREELVNQLDRLKIDRQNREADAEALKLDRRYLTDELTELKKGLKNLVSKLGNFSVESELDASSRKSARELMKEDTRDGVVVGSSSEEEQQTSEEMQLAVLRKLRSLADEGRRFKKDASILTLQLQNERNSTSSTTQERQTEREDLLAQLDLQREEISTLHHSLSTEKDKVGELEERLKEGDRPLKRKVSQLDRNLEQLTVMYHKLVSQNSGLKVECSVLEKKLARKDMRIAALEERVKDAKGKYNKLLNQCANLTAAMEGVEGVGGKGLTFSTLSGGESLKDSRSAGTSLGSPGVARSRNNIVRSIRGGSSSMGLNSINGPPKAPNIGGAGLN